ncbi:MAG: rod shape-determining protein MreB, partial [Pseudoflavonifractor sp.]
MFSSDIGIDLGTATTLIHVKGKGIVLKEPSIVAMDTRSGKVLAVGEEASRMLGKTSDSIRVVRPLEEGVISDYEVTEQMLKHFFKKVNPNKFFKPRVCVCVPSAITEVESRAVIDTVMSSGARNVFLIEEPVAAAIGAGIDITKPGGVAILDIGGGTSDIAVLSLNGIVCKTSIKLAGNTFNQAIIKHVRNTYNVLIGDNTADRI